MRVCVTGSRNWACESLVRDVLHWLLYLDDDPQEDVRIVHGGCPSGADHYADLWAQERGVEVEVFEADWAKHGRAAGPIRNRDMIATDPDMVLAFWDRSSPGTRDTMERAMARGIELRVYTPRRPA